MARRIDIAHLQAQAFAQTQAETVEGEIKHPLTQPLGGEKQPLDLLDGDDIRQALGLGRFDQVEVDPGLVQDMGIVELETVEVEFDRTPGMALQQIGEVVGQLLFGQIINLLIKIGAG